MTTPTPPTAGSPGPWDEDHVKALLSFPRYPVRLVQDEPWQTWISGRGGLKAVYEYLRNYSFVPSHRRILDVVLSNPEEIADVYALHLNISRATYFYRLRELVPAVVHALNQWHLPDAAPAAVSHRIAPLTGLPTPLTSLVGVEDTLGNLVALITRDDVRMLTLVGPGGVGKTRLAIELAHRVSGAFVDRVFYVDLSDLPSTASILPSIGRALSIENASEPEIRTALSSDPSLLVLDNFEHLLSLSGTLADLLVAAPRLKVIVTSRAVPGIYGEHQFLVSPLPLPDAADSDSPAVDLFVQRARSVNPDFALSPANADAVADLVARLDGIPLWIELAAFQAKFYSPQAMLVRLSTSNRLNFLSNIPRGFHTHQQTPREILESSTRLLDPVHLVLFSRLAVFAGGCTVDAAERVCIAPPDDSLPAATGLASLAGQSLLQQHIQSDGEPRYTMIGVIREYARELLDERSETPDIEQRFAEYFLDIAERHDDRPRWLETVRRESANLNAAMQWYLEHQQGEGALRMVAVLWDAWCASGSLAENYRLALSALEQTPSLIFGVRAHVLWLAGRLAHDRADLASMEWAFQSMRYLAAALDDPHNTGLTEVGFAEIACWQSRWPDAKQSAEHALASGETGYALLALAHITFSQGDPDAAAIYARDSAAHFDASGDASRDLAGKADALVVHGQSAFFSNKLDQSALLLEESLHLRKEFDDPSGAGALRAQIILAQIDIQRSLLDAAQSTLDVCIPLARKNHYLSCLDLAHHAQSQIALRLADLPSAKRALRDSLSIQETVREGWRVLDLLESAARFLLRNRESLASARLFGAVERLRTSMGIARFPGESSEHDQAIATLRGQLDEITLEGAWGAGADLPLDQAIRYALRCLE